MKSTTRATTQMLLDHINDQHDWNCGQMRSGGGTKFMETDTCNICALKRHYLSDEQNGVVATYSFTDGETGLVISLREAVKRGCIEEADEAPGPCVTCGTQCVSGGEGSVICPNCDWKERAKRLLEALGDIGQEDLYTDAAEYENRVSAMQKLCKAASQAALGQDIDIEHVTEIWCAANDAQEEEK